MNYTITAEEIQSNWDKLLGHIEESISGPRRDKLLDFYKKYGDRIMVMPASYKREFHNAFPGGYVEHVNRVIEYSLQLGRVWNNNLQHLGLKSDYTVEELVFSALNHDLGKMGSEEHESYIEQTDKWRKDKLGEDYTFNHKVPFASVPDRGLFLLQSHGISYTFNEMVAIQIHDGLYDDANKKYMMTYQPGQKPRTQLPFIIQQADVMAARLEFEREYKVDGVFDFEKPDNFKSKPKYPKKESTKNKAVKKLGDVSINNIFESI